MEGVNTSTAYRRHLPLGLVLTCHDGEVVLARNSIWSDRSLAVIGICGLIGCLWLALMGASMLLLGPLAVVFAVMGWGNLRSGPCPPGRTILRLSPDGEIELAETGTTTLHADVQDMWLHTGAVPLRAPTGLRGQTHQDVTLRLRTAEDPRVGTPILTGDRLSWEDMLLVARALSRAIDVRLEISRANG